ncbi:hypothetical protein ACHAXS_008057 [Conticribra weissflogii]
MIGVVEGGISSAAHWMAIRSMSSGNFPRAQMAKQFEKGALYRASEELGENGRVDGSVALRATPDDAFPWDVLSRIALAGGGRHSCMNLPTSRSRYIITYGGGVDGS